MRMDDITKYFAARSEDRFEFGRDPHPLFDFKRASNGRLKEILLQNCRTHTQSPAADYIDKLKSVIDEGVSLVYECNHLRMNEVEYADCMTHVYYVVFPSETTNIVCRRYCGQDTLRLFTNCVDCLEIPADSICARDSFMSADEFTIDDEMMQWLPYLEVPQFYFGLPNLCDPLRGFGKLRRLMFSLPLHGFALFNHNQETLFCSDYSGLRPIYAAQPHPKTLQPTPV